MPSAFGFRLSAFELNSETAADPTAAMRNGHADSSTSRGISGREITVLREPADLR